MSANADDESFSIRRSRVNLSRAVATWAILCSAAVASRTHVLRGIRGKGGITRRRTGHGARALAFRAGDLSLTAAFRALSQSLLLVQVMRPAPVPCTARHKRFVSTRVALADRQCNTGPKDRRANWQVVRSPEANRARYGPLRTENEVLGAKCADRRAAPNSSYAVLSSRCACAGFPCAEAQAGGHETGRRSTAR